MITQSTLKRKFKVNGTLIDCPSPNASLKEAVRMLARSYPQFRHTRVFEEDGKVEGEFLVYELVMPPAKSNG